MSADAPDLYVVGLGILNVDHLTRETERALRTCREVLYLDTGVATQEFLEGLGCRATSLFAETYADFGDRSEAYETMAARVLDACLRGPPVAFAMQGHPTVGATVPFLLAGMTHALGLSMRVLPGVSALDCLLAELLLDPCFSGLQTYEATDLLLRRRPLLPDVPAVIWQIGQVETRLYSDLPSRPGRFHRLVGHLSQFYAAEHPVTALYASPHPLLPTTRLDFPLARMPDFAPALHAGFSLYIPPAAARPIADAELAGLVDDPAHLGRITYDPSSE